MITNALNGVQSCTYIMQIITQLEQQKLTKIFQKTIDFKDTKFPVKTRDIHKIKKKKKNSISISVFVYKNKEKYPINVSKNAVKINMLICYSLENKSKGNIFLSKILIHLCMIIHSCYLQAFRTAEKVICYIKDCFKIIDKKNKITIYDFC